jgi:glycine/D-amino acid oxidase-like deaminating enzyme
MNLNSNALGSKMTTPKTHDVIIVGAGIFGLSCAYACARRKLSVLVLDAGQVGAGASGGIVGAMAPYTPDQWHPKKQYQLEALDSAEKHWATVDKLSSMGSGYGRIGRICPIVDERTFNLAQTRHEEAKQNWKDFQWDIIEQHPLVPAQAAPFGLIHDTLSARIYPSKACASLARACELLGVEFRENSRVMGFETGKVFGSWGTACANSIVLAGGYQGFHLLDYHFGTQMGAGVKGQAALLDIDMGDAPQIYADGVYVVPHADGTTTVGSTSENKWGQPYEIDHLLDDVVERARVICPSVKDASIIQTWAGLRPKARRRDPMLGPIAEADGVFAAMGGFKIGFGLAHKIGFTLADFIQGIPTELPKSFTVEHHLE